MTTITNNPQAGRNDGDGSQEMFTAYSNDWIQESKHVLPEGDLFYADPAVFNPEELATFPKPVKHDSYHHHSHESHLVNKRTPVRDGRNITRTDNHPEKNGFM